MNRIITKGYGLAQKIIVEGYGGEVTQFPDRFARRTRIREYRTLSFKLVNPIDVYQNLLGELYVPFIVKQNMQTAIRIPFYKEYRRRIKIKSKTNKTETLIKALHLLGV